MEHEWSWKDLSSLAPFVASGFAFAFVVGYFFAFDIAWFSFFGLSEHIAFALRALPVAIGASVAFVMVLRHSVDAGPPPDAVRRGEPVTGHPSLEERQLRTGAHIHPSEPAQPDQLRDAPSIQLEKQSWKQTPLFACLMLVWIVGAIVSARDLHIGLCVTFILMIFATNRHHQVSVLPMSTANIIYWATTMIMMSLITGDGTAKAWRIDRLLPFELKESAAVTLDDESKWVGHVALSGDSGVLLYDYASKHVHFFRWPRVIEVFGCSHPSTAPTPSSPMVSVNGPVKPPPGDCPLAGAANPPAVTPASQSTP